MKTVTIVIPTYNEEANIRLAYERIQETVAPLRNQYRFELLFIDNDSHDGTRRLIRELCKNDVQVLSLIHI